MFPSQRLPRGWSGMWDSPPILLKLGPFAEKDLERGTVTLVQRKGAGLLLPFLHLLFG